MTALIETPGGSSQQVVDEVRDQVIQNVQGTVEQQHRAGLLNQGTQAPAPALVLVSIVSIQLGAAVAVHLFEALGPIGATFLAHVCANDELRPSVEALNARALAVADACDELRAGPLRAWSF